ncbi:TVP38/TMEM64 family protein [filamentous cyanobacterium LEGE 11480]|uniref:TVP38/TMEM64 family membrane protein n=1 Tax=Romeriopsis navalis LEGE 11480 TaxID=2777977 RepID=A0A928VNN6_9CYAN|nr:VTT domain-containing protein [Romeriopsis navalis]MBE9031013.1 TVP38/TMEM64 family protein [Romeriopsis navalis LEGE 11480]
MSPKLRKAIEFVLIIGLIAAAIVFVNQVGLEQIRENIKQFGIWAPIVILLLRLTSITIPVLPGTAYALLSGALFGFVQGTIVIIIADFLACAGNFFIARRYGRGVVQRVVGEHFMGRLDRWSKKYLEGNFFLMTGALMSGFFDYICYAVGLSQMPARKFLSALALSVTISKPPIVAAGAGLISGEKLLLGASVVGVLAIAAVSAWVKRNDRQVVEPDSLSDEA